MNINGTNQSRIYFALYASSWSGLTQQVKESLSDCWHSHAGCWQPESIALHVAPRIMRDAQDAVQQEIHLPQLVSWLRQQGRVVTVLSVDDLAEHRLYLQPTMAVGRSVTG